MSLFQPVRLRSRSAAFVHDLLIVPIAWFGAYWLRFNLSFIPEVFFERAVDIVPIVVMVQCSVFWYFGLYRGVWRFASVPDFVRICQSVAIGTLISAAILFFWTRMFAIPRSVLVLYPVLLILLLSGPRLLYRWLKDRSVGSRGDKCVLIVGAGRAGETLVRELLRDEQREYAPIGFVDDKLSKKGREIQGVRVLGGADDIPVLVEQYGVDCVLLAIPSANSTQIQRLVNICDLASVAYRTLPNMQDLVSGRSVVNELRRISIEDLLGRDTVSLDWNRLRAGMGEKTVLVSGGGGSIGSELCRQIARLNPAKVVIVDSTEFNLYRIEQELQKSFPSLMLDVHLGDVRDRLAMERLVRHVRPQMILHAAAYKHVPLLETHAREAVSTNVLGTVTLADIAVACGVGHFVLISTDKAVNPSNVMGATKRVAELYCQSLNEHSEGTQLVTVRFGNVLDSAGSVVPLFRQQIEAGGPITVTHPGVERYFMTISEACQLILEAAAIGKGGEVFVLDMGTPVRISYLAEQMIKLSGKTPGVDIEITYAGLRPGEKLCEELFYDYEAMLDTTNQKLRLAKTRLIDFKLIQQSIEELRQACMNFDEHLLPVLLTSVMSKAVSGPVDMADSVVPLRPR